MKLRDLSQVAFVFFLLLVLVACGVSESSPTPTHIPPTPTALPSPTPTAIPVPTIAGSEWELVAFGDSRTVSATWPYKFAEHIEEDLGVDVEVSNRAIGGQTSEELLELIQLIEPLRKQIREAEIVTILTLDKAGILIFAYNRFINDCSTEEYQTILEEIIVEIFTLRKDNPTIVRLLEHYNFPGTSKDAFDYFDIRKACFEQYNTIIHTVAEKYGILVVPIYESFNGSSGFENPDDKGFLSDGLHLSQEGDVVIADLFRERGYAPIVP